MANRSERRAQAKRSRRGVPQQYDTTKGRARGGMIDEYSLQERSIRLIEHGTGEWKPTASHDLPSKVSHNLQFSNPTLSYRPHSVRQLFRVMSWFLIIASIIAFLVVMWLRFTSIWVILTVSIVFAVGVLSLFVVAGDPKNNPNVDQHGTAV